MDKFLKQLEELKEKNSNPFEVPDGYFDSLPSRIQNKIIADSEKQPVFKKILVVLKPQLAFAAAFIGIALLSIVTLEYIFKDKATLPVTNGVYTRIIEVDASEFSEQHFIDVLLDENKQNTEEKNNSDEYINFLLDENIDYTTLIDEL
ncbi:MAG: hypothetical protein AB7S50_05340 [Bacteroidales bacterium]